jgi:hypothetical protein
VYDRIKPDTLKQPYLIFEGMKNEEISHPNTARKIFSKQNNSLLDPASQTSNTTLALNSKFFKKTKY